jgi:protocatechuate 3,4-dioxygenase beta subunit
VKRAAILLLALAAGCGGDGENRDRAAATRTCDPTHGAVERIDLAPAGTPSRLKLGPGMELEPTKRNRSAAGIGERLEVTGVVRGEDCAPLAGATVRVWQTNGKGRYGPGRDGEDRCCYLTGTLRTDRDGRYVFVSVMPRGYQGGPAHIHAEAGHPDAEGLVTELVLPKPVTATEFDIVLRTS